MKKRVLMFLVVCMAFLFAGCAEEIDLNEYVDVKYEGISGYGTASYEIDYVDLISDHDEIFGFDDDDLEDGDGEDFLEDMEDAIEGDLSEDKDLTNGDEITFEWDLSAKKIEDKYKVKFVYSDITETVKGLQELEVVDAFEGIEVTFVGNSGYGTAKIDMSNRKYGMFDYIFSDTKNLKNGDVVTITVAEGYMSYCMDAGIMPKDLTKIYTVEGLKELEKFDAFQGLNVIYSGYAPYGHVKLEKKAVKYEEILYFSDAGYLENGEEFTVGMNDISIQNCIRGYGVIPAEMTKTYVVSGLDTLVLELSEVSQATWDSMAEEWRTTLLGDISQNWETPEALKNVTYIGKSISKPSETHLNIAGIGQDHYITLFYELEIEQPGKEPFHSYYYVEFNDFRKTPEGEYVYDEYKRSSASSGFFGMSGIYFKKDDLYYAGYETFEALYEAMIINDRNSYNTFGEFIDGYEYVTE